MKYLVSYLEYEDFAREEFGDLGDAMTFIEENLNSCYRQSFQLYKEIELKFLVEIK